MLERTGLRDARVDNVKEEGEEMEGGHEDDKAEDVWMVGKKVIKGEEGRHFERGNGGGEPDSREERHSCGDADGGGGGGGEEVEDEGVGKGSSAFLYSFVFVVRGRRRECTQADIPLYLGNGRT